MLLPEDIDPATLHHKDSYDIKENLLGIINIVKYKAKYKSEYITINIDFDNHGNESFRIRSYPVEDFESGYIQCPQDADESFKKQNNGFMREIPSVLVKPDAEVQVAKPSLCEGCQHRLHRAMVGDCHGLQFKSLESVYERA